MKAMHTTNRVPEPLPPSLGLLRAARETCLITAWDLSGMLVGRYYERLLQQHGRTPQALAERADDKDLEFDQHLFQGVDLSQPLSRESARTRSGAMSRHARA